MTLASKFTASRLVLAPLFLSFYLLPGFFPSAFIPWTVLILWILFIGSEITDLLDGMIARKRGEISDFGKFFDPFADTLTKVTYFFCFVLDGILPPILFLIVLYREFSILFVRNPMLKKGITMGARLAGKVKTVAYVVTGALALIASSVQRLSLSDEIFRIFSIAATAAFAISVMIAVISFFDYVSVYRKSE